MQPIIYRTVGLYITTSPLYQTNGFGFLTDCTEFLVTMESNGAYSFVAKVKSNDKLLKYINLGSYIKAKANSKDGPQLFYVTKIEADKRGDLTISGEHVSRLFFQNGTEPSYYSHKINATPSEIVNSLMVEPGDSSPVWFRDAPYNFFSFSSNIVKKREFSLGFNTAEKFETIFNDDSEGLIALFKGELRFNNFSITFNKPNVNHSGYRIAFGANVSDYKQTASLGEYFTHVLPYARCQTTSGTEVVVTAIELYPTELKRTIKNTYLLDCTSKIKRYIVNPMDGTNYDEVRDALRSQVATYKYDTSQSAESLSITVNIESELTKMYNLGLYDNVTVVMTDGTEIEKKVAKTVYDSISEKYKEITIGNLDMLMSDLLKIQRRFKR